MTAQTIRLHCRKCRSKLPEPVDDRRAFCCRGCFDQHYRMHCTQCETDVTPRCTGRPRSTCDSRKCRADHRRFPLVYTALESPETAPRPRSARSYENSSRNPITTGSFWRDKSGRAYRWEERDDGHFLLDRSDQVRAIICGQDGDWRITYPRSIPVLTADTLDLRKRALSLAMAALPLDPATKARIDRLNASYWEAAAIITAGTFPVNLLGGYRWPGAPRLAILPD